jgi:hypothetical protein
MTKFTTSIAFFLVVLDEMRSGFAFLPAQAIFRCGPSAELSIP